MEARPEGLLLSFVAWQAGRRLPADRRAALAAASYLGSGQNLVLGALPALLAHQESRAAPPEPQRDLVYLRERDGASEAPKQEEKASTP